MSAAGYARERYGWWGNLSGGEKVEGAFPGWKAAGSSSRMPPETPQAIGLSVSLNRDWSSIASAGFTDDGETFLGAVCREPGTRWLVAEAARIQEEHGCAVAINGAGPGKNLIPDLEDAGVDLTILSDTEACDAYADMRDGVKNRTHVHGQHEELDAAVKVTTERKLAQRLALGQVAGQDGSMAEAAMVAAWAAHHASSDFAVFGGSLELCDRCGEKPHEDPDGVHDYLCPDCREEAP